MDEGATQGETTRQNIMQMWSQIGLFLTLWQVMHMWEVRLSSLRNPQKENIYSYILI